MKKIYSFILRLAKKFSLTERILLSIFILIFIVTGSALTYNSIPSTEVPSYGGTLEEGMLDTPQYINPLLASTDSGKGLTTLIYSGLLKQKNDGGYEPDLAESYTVSNDGLIYDVYLKKNLTFHDGVALDTDDITFTINKAKDPLLKSSKYANWQGVEVRKVDDLHVQFILKTPYSAFIKNLTFGILPEHLWKNAGIDQFTFSSYNFEPIGSGPYQIKTVKRDPAGKPISYELTAFKDYALGRPYIKNISIYFYSDEDALIKAINKGNVTSAGGISSKKVSQIKNSNVEIKSAHLLRMFAVFFNQSNSKFLSQTNNRKILDSALDRGSITKAVLGDFGSPENSPIPSHISKEEVANNLNPDTLKGTSSTAFILSTGNTEELQKTAEILKQAWSKIGVSVEIKTYDAQNLNQEIIKPRKFEALLFGEVVNRELDLYPFWHSSQRANPGLNITSYTNSKADKSLEKGRLATSTEDKLIAYQSFLQEFKSDLPALFLYSPNYIYIVPKGLGGFNLDEVENPEERYNRLSESFLTTHKVLNIFNK